MPPEHLLVQHPHGFNETAASQSLLRTPVEKNEMKRMARYCIVSATTLTLMFCLREREGEETHC